MKKFMSVVALLLVAVMMFGCAAAPKATEPSTEATVPAPTAPAGTLEELHGKLYENLSAVEMMLMPMALDVTDTETVTYITGISDTTLVKEALMCEPMTGSQPYSLVLVRVNDESKAAEVAQTMFDNIDTRKWICVEADTKVAAYCGDLVMFFMVGSQLNVHPVSEMVTAFTTLCGGSVAGVID
jgi:hypothetical protein